MLPGGITTIVVTGTYLTPAGDPVLVREGRPAEVTFTPSSVITDGTGKVIFTTRPAVALLNAEGQFSITLACTDNTSLNPSGWVWNVSEVIPDLGRSYSVLLPSTLGETVDISDVAPVAEVTPVSSYVLSSQVGAPSGVAALDSTGHLPAAEVPDLSAEYLSLAGGTMTGPVVLPGTPTASLQAATKAYVDASGGGALAGVNITSYGASLSAPDNGPAINAAIASLPSSGGVIAVPPGIWAYSTPITLAGRTSITIAGQANPGGGATMTSMLVYTGTGTASAVSMQNSNAIVLRNLALMYSSSSMTGILTDWRNVTGSDTSYGLIDNCYLGSSPSTINSAQSLVNVDKCINMTVRKCNLAGATYGIYGRSVAGNYSNAVQIESCVFHAQATAHIWNAGQAWTVTGCTFEALAGGTAGAYAHDSGVNADGLTFTGCWTGDTTGGTVFTVSGAAVNFTGNWIGATGGTCIYTDDVVTGLIVMGNDFEGASVALKTIQPAGSTAATGWVILGNTYTSVTSNLSGNFTAGCLWHNGGYILNSYGLNVNGTLTLVDGNSLVVGNTVGAKISTTPTAKLGFWGATPVGQPSTTGTATGFTANSGTAVQDASTFTGGLGSTAYRISDIVLALKQAGLLAQ